MRGHHTKVSGMLRFTICCAAAAGVSGFALPGAGSVSAVSARRHEAARMDIDLSTVVGVGAALVGVGGGIGLIAFTEGAGKRNEETENIQACFECKAAKVVTCTICRGAGEDQFASYVAGVREEVGETSTSSRVVVDDWDEGEKEVEVYAEILAEYPVKATQNVCINCDGRGVVVCDNCQGTGIQPRFLERFSPDDFMD